MVYTSVVAWLTPFFFFFFFFLRIVGSKFLCFYVRIGLDFNFFLKISVREN